MSCSVGFLYGCQCHLQAVLIPLLAYKVLVQAINIRVQDLTLVLSVTRAQLINKGFNDENNFKEEFHVSRQPNSTFGLLKNLTGELK